MVLDFLDILAFLVLQLLLVLPDSPGCPEHLKAPEILEYLDNPDYLEILVSLGNPVNLGIPGLPVDPGDLENLGFPVLLNLILPVHLGILGFLVHLMLPGILGYPDSLVLLGVLVVLETPENPVVQ